jgi:hypothetical protein
MIIVSTMIAKLSAIKMYSHFTGIKAGKTNQTYGKVVNEVRIPVKRRIVRVLLNLNRRFTMIQRHILSMQMVMANEPKNKTSYFIRGSVFFALQLLYLD